MIESGQSGSPGGDGMKRYSVQMLSHGVSPDWWRALIGRFVRVGDPVEIRCWREELAETARAARYGTAVEEGSEVSIRGVVTEELRKELLTGEPADRSLYNKMTDYFTLHVKNGLCHLWSEHYGTELYLEVASDGDAAFFEEVMARYPGDFSVGTL